MRTTKDYTLHRYCTAEQWEPSASRFRKSFPAWAKENDILRTYEQRASDALRDFEREGLTFYVARHSYGMALKTKGVSRDIISEALGHSDVRTTDHYLKDFEAGRLDLADDLLF